MHLSPAAQVDGAGDLPTGFFQAIIEGSHDAVIAVDARLNVIFANAAAERMFGVEAAELRGHPLDRLLPDRARATHGEQMRQMNRAGPASQMMGQRGRIEGLHADGSIVPLDATILHWHDGDGVYYAAILRDATQTIEQEDRLRQTATEARRLAAVRSDFLANVSHELRTPLNAVIGFAECILLIAERGGSVTKFREYAEHIVDAGRHLLALVNDVLDMSQLESTQRLLHESKLRLTDLVQQSIRLLSERALRRRQRLVADIPADLMLYADPTAMLQILVNLVGNSLKYSPDPGTVRVYAAQEDDGTLSLVVEDEGRGMTPEEAAQATQPFQRFIKSDSAAIPGTGLGLAIVDALLKLHGATMRIDSEPGRGTAIHLNFPAQRVSRAAA